MAGGGEVTPEEEVGHAMIEYVLTTYGRKPSQEEFERMYHAWYEEVERLYDE